MTIKRNIVANYIGTGSIAVIPLLAIPWYLDALGPQQFGLVSFIVMLQSVLGLIDAGMGQALIREMSIRFGLGEAEQHKAAELLYGFERIYWIIALIGALLTASLAGFLSGQWLNLGDVPSSEGRNAVLAGAVLFAVQFPGSLYRSMLVAAQAQVALNVVISIALVVRHLGAVLLLFKWPDLMTYMAWHCTVGLFETLARAYLAWGCTSVPRKDLAWSSKVLRSTWGFVAKLSAAALLGALTVQMDKIILSKMVSVDEFGYYVIAASVAIGAMQLIYPLVQAVLPNAIRLHAEPGRLRELSVRLLKYIASVVSVAVILFMCCGYDLLQLWLGNTEAVEVVFPLLAVLLIGSVLNAFYNVGYINWIAHENVHRVLQVNVISVLLSMILIPFLVHWNGVIGAAFGWVIINSIGFILSLEWLKFRRC